MFISPTLPFPGLWGLAGSQGSQEGAVVAVEVGGSLGWQSPWQRAQPAGAQPRVPALGMALAEKGFFQERASVGLIWDCWMAHQQPGCLPECEGATSGPRTCWDLWKQQLCSVGLGWVEQKAAPLKAELSPSQERDVALPPCWRLKDGTPTLTSCVGLGTPSGLGDTCERH